MFNINRFPIPLYLIKHSLDEVSVLRMRSLQYELHGRLFAGVEFENSKRFVGPNDVSTQHVPSEATRSTRSLCFR